MQDLLVDHADHALVDVQHETVFLLDLLELLEEGLDKDAQVELDSPRLLARVGVDVLDPDGLRHELHDLDHPVQGVNIDKVYNLLLEELNQLLVNLVQQLGVFARQLLQALSEHQDQLLGLRVLHWDLDCLLAPHLDGGEAIHPKGGNSGLLEDFRDFCVEDEPILRVFGGDLR